MVDGRGLQAFFGMLVEDFYSFGRRSFDGAGDSLSATGIYGPRPRGGVSHVAYKLMKLRQVQRDIYYFDITVEIPCVKQGESFIVELFPYWQYKMIG